MRCGYCGARVEDVSAFRTHRATCHATLPARVPAPRGPEPEAARDAELHALAREWARAMRTTDRCIERLARTGSRRDRDKAAEAGRHEDAVRRAYVAVGGPLPVPRRFPKGGGPGQGGAPKQGVFSKPSATARPSSGCRGLLAFWAKRDHRKARVLQPEVVHAGQG